MPFCRPRFSDNLRMWPQTTFACARMRMYNKKLVFWLMWRHGHSKCLNAASLELPATWLSHLHQFQRIPLFWLGMLWKKSAPPTAEEMLFSFEESKERHDLQRHEGKSSGFILPEGCVNCLWKSCWIPLCEFCCGFSFICVNFVIPTKPCVFKEYPQFLHCWAMVETPEFC